MKHLMRGRLANQAAIALVRLYQVLLGPLLGGQCRFYPTCSQYALDAYRKYGFFKATCKSIGRILRCNPFNPGGFDPA